MDAFPLPEPLPSAAAAAAATERQRQALAAALVPALQLLLDVTAAQAGALDAVTSRARTLASRRTSASAARLGNITGQAPSLGSTRTAEQAAQLAMLMPPPPAGAAPPPAAPPPVSSPAAVPGGGWYCLKTLASGEVRVIQSPGLPTGSALPPGFFVAGGPFPDEGAARRYCASWELAAAPGAPAAPPPPAGPPPPAPAEWRVAVWCATRSWSVVRWTSDAQWAADVTARGGLTASAGHATQAAAEEEGLAHGLDLVNAFCPGAGPPPPPPGGGGGPPPPPPGGGGPGGGGPPPPPPPAARQWFCARDPSTGELSTVQALSADALEEGGATDVTGPYPTEAVAALACVPRALLGGGADDTEYPPAPPCAIPGGASASAMPGTQEWCDGIDAMLEWFTEAGNAVMAWAGAISQRSAVQDLIDRLETQAKSNRLAQAVADVIVWTLKQLLGTVEWAVNTAGKVIECALSLYRQLFPACNPAAYVALAVVKAFVTIAKQVQVGVNAAVWLMAGVSIELPAVEQAIDTLLNVVCPRAVPSYAEASAAFRYGYISEEVRDCLSRAEGKDPEAWRPYRLGASQHLTLEQHLEALRRLGAGAGAEREAFRRAGWIDDHDIALREKLSWRVPTLGELLRRLTAGEWASDWWKRTGAWDYQWDNFWGLHAQGLLSQGVRQRDAHMLFAAARPVPGPGQLQRLLERFGGEAPGGARGFGADDYRQGLEAEGYTPYWVERLGALADQDVARARAASGRGWTLAAVLAAYAAGRHDEPWARKQLTALGYSGAQQDDALERALEEPWVRAAAGSRRRVVAAALTAALAAYRLGALTVDQLAQQLGAVKIDRPTAEAWAAVIDAQERQRLVQAQIRGLATAVKGGKVTADDALVALATSGIRADRAQELVTAWAAQSRWRNPEPSALRIVRWVQLGLLPVAVARQRLVNLGWQQADVLLMLAEARGALRVRRGKALAAELKRQDGAASAVAKLLRQAKTQQRELVGRLKQLASPTRLRKWYVRGIITEPQLREALLERGIGEPWAEAWVKEAVSERTEALARKARQAGARGAGKPAGAGGSGTVPPGDGLSAPGDQ